MAEQVEHAKKRDTKKEKDNNSSDSANHASARVVTVVEDEFDDDTSYATSYYATETANLVSTFLQWLIDSGASRHFSPTISDFI